MLPTQQGDLYDFPKYYDLVYGSDWKAEFDFLNACFGKHTTGKVKNLFEPACGTGRLLWRFAKAGFAVSGNDLNANAIDFCNARLVKHGCEPTAFVGDMSNFRLPKPVDAAFNTINSFRHLQTEEAALGHMQCIADALVQGGIYVLGLHLTPTVGTAIEEEQWAARRGNLSVLSHMKTVHVDSTRRLETVCMHYDVYTPTKAFRITDTFDFRTYTAPQMVDLIHSAGSFEVLETYDFAYEIDQPIEVTTETEDILYVLRKK